MDLTSIDSILELIKGINPIFLIIGYFLFKDKIDLLFKPKPADPTVPVTPVPPVVVPPAPVERPILNLVTTQILPVLLPILIKLIQDQIKSAKAEDGKVV